MHNPNPSDDGVDPPEQIQQPRLWRDDGWTAKVIKNEDDEGWAVAMYKDGQADPALVGPWTMGRDKKNPKPLDPSAFHTLVKTASEVLRRHEQQRHAMLHKQVQVDTVAGRFDVLLDIVPDDDDPHAFLSARDADGTTVARTKVAASFRFSTASATRWVESGFGEPG